MERHETRAENCDDTTRNGARHDAERSERGRHETRVENCDDTTTDESSGDDARDERGVGGGRPREEGRNERPREVRRDE